LAGLGGAALHQFGKAGVGSGQRGGYRFTAGAFDGQQFLYGGGNFGFGGHGFKV
jgi:hypothetical protein